MTKRTRSTHSTDSAPRSVSSEPATETREEERVIVPYEEAVKRVGDSERIHTFRQASFTLIGADWDREDILAAFKRYEVEETGPQARAMRHGLAFSDDHGYVFVETALRQRIRNRSARLRTHD